MTAETARGMQPPYVSFRTVYNFLDRLSATGIPQYVDRHYWGEFLAGGVGQQLMGALRFLGLIEGEANKPTPTLGRLVDPEQRKRVLAELIRERYAPVLDVVDLARTTPGHLYAEFGRHYKLENETRRKALTFLTHAAQYAELPLSPQLSGKVRAPRASAKSTTKAGGRRSSSNGATVPPARQDQPAPARPQESAPATSGEIGNRRTLTFLKGGSVTLIYDVDLFTMDKEDRTYLLDLIDGFTAHQDKIAARATEGTGRTAEEKEDDDDLPF